MSTSILTLEKVVPARIRDDDLQDEDGVPLETYWHRLAMNLLLEVTECYLQGGPDYFAGGNMFIYYRNKNNKRVQVRGPDYFFLWGKPSQPMPRFWAVWKEQDQYPDVIIELASPSTIKIDKGKKKRICQKKFRTHEYFIYDPDKEQLFGWRLEDGRYQRIVPNERGWLWCAELGLWLGTWQGKFLGKESIYLRFFDKNGQLVPTFTEAEKKLADAAKQQADAARQQAELEKRRADEEKLRADQAEAELARLRAHGRKKK